MKCITEFPMNRPVSIPGKSRQGFVIQHNAVTSLHQVCWSCQQPVSNHSVRSNKISPVRDQYRTGWPVNDVLVQHHLVLREPEAKKPVQLLLKKWFNIYGNFWCYSSIQVSNIYSNSGKSPPSSVYGVYCKSSSDLLFDLTGRALPVPRGGDSTALQSTGHGSDRPSSTTLWCSCCQRKLPNCE